MITTGLDFQVANIPDRWTLELKGANGSLEVIQFDRKNCLSFRLVHVKLLHCVVAATSEGRSLRQLTVAIMSLRQVRKEVQSISQLRS